MMGLDLMSARMWEAGSSGASTPRRGGEGGMIVGLPGKVASPASFLPASLQPAAEVTQVWRWHADSAK